MICIKFDGPGPMGCGFHWALSGLGLVFMSLGWGGLRNIESMTNAGIHEAPDLSEHLRHVEPESEHFAEDGSRSESSEPEPNTEPFQKQIHNHGTNLYKALENAHIL